MTSSSPAQLFKDKYSNIFVSDVLSENQELREKEPKKCLLLERFHCKTYRLWTPLQKSSSEKTGVIRAKARDCQDLAKPPGNCSSLLHMAAALGSPHLLGRSCLEDQVFLSSGKGCQCYSSTSLKCHEFNSGLSLVVLPKTRSHKYSKNVGTFMSLLNKPSLIWWCFVSCGW